jgi:hypothetical protein
MTPRSSRQGTPPAIDNLYFGYRERRRGACCSGLSRSDLVLWPIASVSQFGPRPLLAKADASIRSRSMRRSAEGQAQRHISAWAFHERGAGRAPVLVGPSSTLARNVTPVNHLAAMSAPRESSHPSAGLGGGFCDGFRTPPTRTCQRAPGPASESRQRTKPRGVGHPADQWALGNWLAPLLEHGPEDVAPARQTKGTCAFRG